MTGPTVYAGFLFQMTIDALLHGENLALAHSLHFLHLPMAGLASYVCGYVPFVAEVNEIRQIVDFDPLDRTPRLPKMDQLLNFRLLFSDILVTAHTKLHGRYACNNGTPGIDMAIEAVDFVLACVKLVTEIDRLHRRRLARVEAENGYHDRKR